MIIESDFKPISWLSGRHIQTILGSFINRNLGIHTVRERVELPDGDFIDIDWLNHQTKSSSPTILFLHGLEGSIESSYIQELLQHYEDTDWRIGVMHFRGCSGEPNRLPRSYHSGDTADLDYIVSTLESDTELYVVGFSLGGNVLLKYLGEQGKRSRIRSAIAVSVPFSLGDAARTLDTGLSRLYRWHLLNYLKEKTRQKKDLFPNYPWPENDLISKISTFSEFDHEITAPLHGFKSGEDYYQCCSCAQFLKSILTPTLIIHAKDDPFMTADSIPTESQLSESITLEITEKGGHMGFLQTKENKLVHRYLSDRIPQWIGLQYSKVNSSN